MLRKSFINSNLNRIQILSTSNLNPKHHLSTTSQLNRKPALTSVISGKKPKVVTDPVDALGCLDSNCEIYSQMGINTSTILINALSEVVKQRKLKNVKVHQLLTVGVSESWKELHENGSIRGNSFFTSGDNRKLVNSGFADYTPMFLSDAARYFDDKRQLEAVITQVSPPDEHGFYSLGGTIVCIKEAIQSCKNLIVQVNKNMCRTFGDATIHESQIDYLIEKDTPLPELVTKEFTDEDKKIGKLIAENLIEDGSTLQLGIGNLPDSVLKECKNFKNLGVHSEMISDGLIDLVEAGCITNHLKAVERDVSVVSFVLGSKRLFKHLNNNPGYVFKSGSYVNSEYVIRQNPKIVAINAAIEIDLQGQACSDTLGRNVYSGFGGQVDFLRGAATSIDGKGKPILAMHSRTNKGESKIVLDIKPGSGVTSSRANVHYVVTEFGIANLFGKTLRQRAYELIQIAHPSFRESLEKGAFEKLRCMPSRD